MAVIKAILKSILPITELPRITPPTNILDIPFTTIQGKTVHLHDFPNHHFLLVNTATECGFTEQLKGLQKFADDFNNQVKVIGFPCNQFKNQEPREGLEIASFCELNYGVDFLFSEKIDVHGPQQHAMYQWLSNREKNGVLDSEIEWNFQKYWVDNTGALRAVIYTSTKPSASSVYTFARKILSQK